jgi:hypothetical protein
MSSVRHPRLDDFLPNRLNVAPSEMQNHHTPITIAMNGLPCCGAAPYLLFVSWSHGCALHAAMDLERGDAR